MIKSFKNFFTGLNIFGKITFIMLIASLCFIWISSCSSEVTVEVKEEVKVEPPKPVDEYICSYDANIQSYEVDILPLLNPVGF